MSTDDYITVPDAAKLLGVTRTRVGQMIEEKKLSVALRAGQVRLLRRADVEAINPPGRGWRKKSEKDNGRT